MKSFAILAAAVLGLTLGIGDADAAKRLGSGKSFGMQRSAPPPSKSAAAPTQAPSAAAPAAAGAAGKPAGRSWMGPVAGLAAGLGLAALASHLGFGEELASFLLMGLIALAVMAAIGFFLRKRAGNLSPALAGAGAGMPAGSYQRSANAVEAFSPSQYASSAGPSATADSELGRAQPPAVPPGFDVDGFLRNAKVQFIRLQAANDAGNLDDLRSFTTPEVFAELRLAVSERGAVSQATDVVELDAQLLELVEDEGRYVASIRFTGVIREDGEPAEAIDEVWHLTKPLSDGGWLLAGIQQAA